MARKLGDPGLIDASAAAPARETTKKKPGTIAPGSAKLRHVYFCDLGPAFRTSSGASNSSKFFVNLAQRSAAARS